MNKQKIIELMNKGSLVAVELSPTLTVHYVLGMVFFIKQDWIAYMSAFPDKMQDIHDCIVSDFVEYPDAVQFKDQLGRSVSFGLLEPYEEDEIKLFTEWKEELKKRNYDIIVQERLENPERFLGEKVVRKYGLR